MKKIILFSLIGINSLDAQPLHITASQAREIGQKIWQNECNGTQEGLTSWNAGEDFASLGIGHFIWYPKGKKGIFKESFPSLLTYFKKHGKKIPYWLETSSGLPWKNKNEFESAKNSIKMKQLRRLLLDTIELQTKFIIERLFAVFENIEKKLPCIQAQHIKKQFHRVAQSQKGFYPLIDYVNFKGEGFDAKESYNNQGWGLLQVLELMHGTAKGKPALDEFAKAAKQVLRRRINNAPSGRNEARWLNGWFKRIDTYVA